jgi:hypothetical protein
VDRHLIILSVAPCVHLLLAFAAAERHATNRNGLSAG